LGQRGGHPVDQPPAVAALGPAGSFGLEHVDPGLDQAAQVGEVLPRRKGVVPAAADLPGGAPGQAADERGIEAPSGPPPASASSEAYHLAIDTARTASSPATTVRRA